MRDDRYLNRTIMASDKQQEKRKIGKAELHDGDQPAPAGCNVGICKFLRWGENLCSTCFVSRPALVFVKKNNLITIALVLALNVLLVRFSGVKSLCF